MWHVEETEGNFTGLECEFKPTCQYCGTVLECITVKPLRFPLRWPDGMREGFAIDVDVKCPKCHDTEVFGVAVAKEHYEKIFQKAGKRGDVEKDKESCRAQADEVAQG